MHGVKTEIVQSGSEQNLADPPNNTAEVNKPLRFKSTALQTEEFAKQLESWC